MEREELGEVDMSRSEGVEVELNRLMVKRSPREIDADERDELWKASVTAYDAQRREENRLAWRESTTQPKRSVTRSFSRG
jgi:hypothetical protein